VQNYVKCGKEREKLRETVLCMCDIDLKRQWERKRDRESAKM
jgi:hypothetical protein